MFIELYFAACFGLDRLKSAGSNQDNGFHRSRFFIDPITETEETSDETQTSHDIYVSKHSYIFLPFTLYYVLTLFCKLYLTGMFKFQSWVIEGSSKIKEET